MEETIEIDFCKQEREVLEVLPLDRLAAAVVDETRMTADVLIELADQVVRQTHTFYGAVRQRPGEVRDTLAVLALGNRVEQIFQRREVEDFQQREEEFLGNEFLGQMHLGEVVSCE